MQMLITCKVYSWLKRIFFILLGSLWIDFHCSLLEDSHSKKAMSWDVFWITRKKQCVPQITWWTAGVMILRNIFTLRSIDALKWWCLSCTRDAWVSGMSRDKMSQMMAHDYARMQKVISKEVSISLGRSRTPVFCWDLKKDLKRYILQNASPRPLFFAKRPSKWGLQWQTKGEDLSLNDVLFGHHIINYERKILSEMAMLKGILFWESTPAIISVIIIKGWAGRVWPVISSSQSFKKWTQQESSERETGLTSLPFVRLLLFADPDTLKIYIYPYERWWKHTENEEKIKKFCVVSICRNLSFIFGTSVHFLEKTHQGTSFCVEMLSISQFARRYTSPWKVCHTWKRNVESEASICITVAVVSWTSCLESNTYLLSLCKRVLPFNCH